MLRLALGICWFAIGAALRRTLPAAFGVVVGFVGLVLVAKFRYPTLMTPLSLYYRFDQPDLGLLRNNGLVV